MQELRFFRCHVSEDAARALIFRDLEAFEKEFPGIVKRTSEHMLLDRFIHYGVVGCIIQVIVEAEAETLPLIDMWLERLNNAVMLETMFGVQNG